ncbi:zinc finger HIT domain-containing protein 3 isoform X2 [Pseudophryne corroboree]|uniref:zinc finger HIT domain-containing protein 3 isoform X2 n=1 Tax=Pseudophryne corroboree TaxID=495146 RepID=UPI0030817A28
MGTEMEIHFLLYCLFLYRIDNEPITDDFGLSNPEAEFCTWCSGSGNIIVRSKIVRFSRYTVLSVLGLWRACRRHAACVLWTPGSTAAPAAALAKECTPKEAPETTDAAAQPASSSYQQFERKDDLLEDDESDTVPLQKLKLLEESEDLKQLLQNTHLRQVLLALERAEKKEEAFVM